MVQVSMRQWGFYQGKEVFLFNITGPGICAAVSNYGALLQSFKVQDAREKDHDIVLGYDTFEQYLKDPNFFGAMIGPIADRLAKGKCMLDGQMVQLQLNAGEDCMHSGPLGFHSQLWDWDLLPDGVAFHRCFENFGLGFPGELQTSLIYRITQPGVLRLEYWASCSKETALSLTNHSYFNLDDAEQSSLNNKLRIYSDLYAETRNEKDPLVTGRLLSVENTPFDFRLGRRLGDAVGQKENREIAAAGGIDHYFAVRGSDMRDMAQLSSPKSGLQLTCRSDADGLLVYTGNGLSDTSGKLGKVYSKNWGICLETGQLPNAVNFKEHRESVLLSPKEKYHSYTEFIVNWQDTAVG